MKKRTSINKGGKHMFGSDGYIHMARRMVTYVKYYFKNMFSIFVTNCYIQEAQTAFKSTPIDMCI